MIGTLVSLAMQMARLVIPPRRSTRHTAPTPGGAAVDRFGHCPTCQAFICLGAAGPDGLAACPRCKRLIEGVEPPT